MNRDFQARRMLLAGGVVWLAARPLGAAPRRPLAWSDVPKIVRQAVVIPGYLPGDLISQSQAVAAFEALSSFGWKVAERAEIEGKVLPDQHFLVKELRTPAGIKFARAVSKESNAFDRLDRLTEFAGGTKLIHSLVHLPDGARLMGEKPTAGFGDLTQLLPKQANGKTPRDKDFSKPTGRIYTEAQLVTALEKSWQKKKS